MNRPFRLIATITLLALCFTLTPTLRAQEYVRVCENGVCRLAPVHRAANVVRSTGSAVRGTVYNTRSYVRSAPIRRGLFGRRVVTHYSPSSSYSTSYGSAGGAGAVSEQVTYVETPAVASVPATPPPVATAAKAPATCMCENCDCCDCEDKLAELEARIKTLEARQSFGAVVAPPQTVSVAPVQPAEKSNWTAIAAIAIATLPLITRQA